MTVIVTALVILTVTSICIASAAYWWSECTYARNELDWYKHHTITQEPTQEEQMTINLNKLAVAICEKEGGKANLTIAQVKDVLAAMGEHWRTVAPEVAASEYAAIVERAGLKSK